MIPDAPEIFLPARRSPQHFCAEGVKSFLATLEILSLFSFYSVGSY